jgi:hypothetical protein
MLFVAESYSHVVALCLWVAYTKSAPTQCMSEVSHLALVPLTASKPHKLASVHSSSLKCIQASLAGPVADWSVYSPSAAASSYNRTACSCSASDTHDRTAAQQEEAALPQTRSHFAYETLKTACIAIMAAGLHACPCRHGAWPPWRMARAHAADR